MIPKFLHRSVKGTTLPSIITGGKEPALSFLTLCRDSMTIDLLLELFNFKLLLQDQVFMLERSVLRHVIVVLRLLGNEF